MKKGKKGLSTIVITLIIIVLSLVAIGVVWGVAGGILKSGTSQTGLSQFTIKLDIKNAYEESGKISVNVQRAVGEGELVKIKFIFSDGQSSESINQDCSMEALDSQTFILTPTQFISTEVASVSIAPIFKSSGGEETVGSITDTYNIISGGNSNENSNENSEENGEDTSCTPNCVGLECGLDPICGQSCGTCSWTDVCTNGICVPLDCVPETTVTTCGAQTCGTKINNCGAEIECLPGCSSGTICEDDICVLVTPINEGTVEDVWPGTSGLYFGSSSLPTDVNYQGKYIKFPESSETRCLLIIVYRFPVEGYEKSHIGFNFETSIISGNTYRIFETSDECQAA